MHGWLHEPWAGLDVATERELAARATAAHTRASGIAPLGLRAPGGRRSAASDAILCDLGYEYDASLGDRMRPARFASGLAQVPFVWPAVDGFHYLRHEPTSPESVRDHWLAALARVAEEGGLFLVVCHAFLTGVDDARLAALDAVIAAAARDSRIAIRTAGEVARAIPR
jgi:peptidoglycan/xylan/chitin deacetylase (PgdA/CDA1 family)